MKVLRVLCGQLLCAVLLSVLAVCTVAAPPSSQPDVPTVDAGIGSCRADFHVKDGAGKPLYNAKINITIKYGFLNLHKAQLEAPTNTDGEARFAGLPNFPKKPLKFVISSGTVSKTVMDDPANNCNAEFNIILSVH